MLMQQEELVKQLTAIMTTILSSKDDRIKRVTIHSVPLFHLNSPSFQMERLQSLLQQNKLIVDFKYPIRLPVDPDIQVSKVVTLINHCCYGYHVAIEIIK